MRNHIFDCISKIKNENCALADQTADEKTTKCIKCIDHFVLRDLSYDCIEEGTNLSKCAVAKYKETDICKECTNTYVLRDSSFDCIAEGTNLTNCKLAKNGSTDECKECKPNFILRD